MSYQEHEKYLEQRRSEIHSSFPLSASYSPYVSREKIQLEKRMKLPFILGAIFSSFSLLFILGAIYGITLLPNNIWGYGGILSTILANILYYPMSLKLRQKLRGRQARLHISILFAFAFAIALFTPLEAPNLYGVLFCIWILALTYSGCLVLSIRSVICQ